jgi:predicted glycoside hydrolase/deacetylase ChbG (UPF0249 family)
MSPVPAAAHADVPRTMRLIVTADGFGDSPEVNRRILAAHRGGILTSASLMVTARGAAEAAALAREHSTLGVGLHVALSGESPVLPAFEIPSLVDERGRLVARPSAMAGARPKEILDEVRAQHRRFRQIVGRLPTHLDVKEDAHLQRPVFEALLTLAWEMGVPVRGVTPAMRQQARREDLRTIDHFLEQPAEGSVDALLQLLAGIESGVSELRYRACRASRDAVGATERPSEQEWDALTDARVREAVASRGIELIHFGQL